MARQETFSSRWGLIVAGLGMAVGTGNMWRFPRIVAQNGGAAFLIPWLIFLFSWSLPLLIAEFAFGRGARRGVVGAFADLIGRRYAWMGGFIAVTSVMILFYYSVVTGWTLKYVLASLTGQLGGPDAEHYWIDYSSSIWQPLGFSCRLGTDRRRHHSSRRGRGNRARQQGAHPGAVRTADRGGCACGDSPGR